MDQVTIYLFCSFFLSLLYWTQKEKIYEFIHVYLQIIEQLKDSEEENLLSVKEEGANKSEIRYEDKYLEQIHEMNPEYVLTEEEEVEKKELYYMIKQQLQNDLIKNKKISEEEDDENQTQTLEKEKAEILDQLNNEEELQKQAEKKVIQKRLEKLKKCFIIEKTPLGNVVMYYNPVRETFEYYSDNTIPYRFLEVVGRKYVITYCCRPLYVIMEEELKKYEKQMEEKIKQIEEKIKQMEETNMKNVLNEKKNVFAKFKSYNKEAGSGRVNKAPPPKNSIPNTKIDATKNEKILLKENANRYTYEGRFSNFNPLQKIERKKIDQKYALTFADFKKMQNKGK